MICSFFLGANTPKGFYSLFSQLDSFDLSIIKGGSGSGKSTLMRKFIEKTEYSGLCEQILCSSDINSLDGAIFHSLNCAVADGTAPHVAEVQGLGKYILTPPPLADMHGKRNIINALKQAKKLAYSQAYSSLYGYYTAKCAISELIPFDKRRFLRRADGILKREIRQTGKEGKVFRRFTDAINANGFVSLFSTFSTLSDRVYVIDDPYSLASDFMEAMERGIVSRGYDVFSCMSPIEPDKIRHLIVPELRLSFVTSDSLSQYKGKSCKVIHTASCIDKSALRRVRSKVRLYTKLSQQLFEDATAYFKDAQSAHRELEGVYRPHLDIDTLNRIAEAESIV